MGKLVRNAAVSPSEDKFKRIKLSNSKVKTTIVDTAGGVQSLLAMGWIFDEADKDFLVLPKGTQMSMKEVRHSTIAQLPLHLSALSAVCSLAGASHRGHKRPLEEADFISVSHVQGISTAKQL